ncbi:MULTISPECIES: ArsC/Spx/MgsR family protein [Lactococcus]|jgi:regulatory protein spx|uniref:ArsC/Spx/MgsR family protein n=1 Tax=Lactococcus TaxID=1357 RepID=UPI002078CEB9|nr:ArsC/Spx/MgsR family protein [Lactococcus petauri]USI65292.1 hypothetical protein LMK05_10770 [Lactococcus petauri]USI67787.1 hypothetical protein LMK04_10005 [Lactococcus petauri]WJE12448.1 ArsC/Spx/MgsR family protein [Lactococcus petauri]
MVIVICKKHRSSRQSREVETIELLERWGHHVERRYVEQLTPSLLVEALRVSRNGFEDIMVKNPQSQASKEGREYCYSLSFNQAITYLIHHHELLRTPLIMDEKKLLAGYKSEELRLFVPRFREKLEI